MHGNHYDSKIVAYSNNYTKLFSNELLNEMIIIINILYTLV